MKRLSDLAFEYRLHVCAAAAEVVLHVSGYGHLAVAAGEVPVRGLSVAPQLAKGTAEAFAADEAPSGDADMVEAEATAAARVPAATQVRKNKFRKTNAGKSSF
ncbi:hypothetical protein ACWEHA_11650 [Amycolatopsis nivea]